MNNNQGGSPPSNPPGNNEEENFQTNVYYINYSFTIPEGTDGPSISDLAGLFGFNRNEEGVSGNGGRGTAGTGTTNENSNNTQAGGVNRLQTFIRNMSQQFTASAAGNSGSNGDTTSTGTTTSGGTGTPNTTGTTGTSGTFIIPNIELAFTNIFQDNNRNTQENPAPNSTTSASTPTTNTNTGTQDFWRRFTTDGFNSNGETTFYTGTFPVDIRMPAGANLFGESRKTRASDRAVSKLKVVDLNSLPESERTCPICFENYTELEKEEKKEDKEKEESEENVDRMDESDDPPISIPGSHPEDDPSESVPGEYSGNIPPEIPEATTSQSSTASKSHHAVEMPCNHQFGNSCISEWLSSSNTCPLCRTTIESQDDYLRSIGQQPESDNASGNLFDLIFNVIPNLMGTQRSNSNNNNNTENSDDNNNNENNFTTDTGAATSSSPPPTANTPINRNNESTTTAFSYTSNSSSGSSTSIPPSVAPSVQPSVQPSSQPSGQPSGQPSVPSSDQPPVPPIPPRTSPQFLRPISVFLQSLQNRTSSTSPIRSTGPVRSNARNSPTPSPSSPGFSASSVTASSNQPNSRGGGTGGGVWIGPAGILSSWGPRWARRHHPYRSPNSEQSDDSEVRTPTASRSASRNAEINDHTDLQCASAPLSLCLVDPQDSHDDNEQNSDENPNRIVRLHCGHGYHIPCLRVGMRAHGDREIPNLTGGLDNDDGGTRQVWCMRCRRYQDITNHD